MADSRKSEEAQANGNQADTISVFKKDKRVLKFMKKYRYNYGKDMFTDLATLVRDVYQEGYWNGTRLNDVNDLLSTNPQSQDKGHEEAQ